jgi:DNA adenine methylase
MIGALVPWYGCKRSMAPTIVEQLGTHRVYWEPFCGSCSVLFAKERVTYESVNDLHADLINLALVVQDPTSAERLYDRVGRLLFHEDLLPVAKGYLSGTDPVPGVADPERAYWYLVFSWMGLNGISGTPLNRTGTFAVRYSGKGGNGATRWRSVTESIPDWHERLRGVQILRRDAFAVLERIDDAAGTALYVDPPYIAKGSKYVHDFAAADHERLAALLRRFKAARVVLSYYADPRLDALYPGWAALDCSALVAKSMVNSGMRDQSGRTLAPEVLLCNQTLNGCEAPGMFGAMEGTTDE